MYNHCVRSSSILRSSLRLLYIKMRVKEAIVLDKKSQCPKCSRYKTRYVRGSLVTNGLCLLLGIATCATSLSVTSRGTLVDTFIGVLLMLVSDVTVVAGLSYAGNRYECDNCAYWWKVPPDESVK